MAQTWIAVSAVVSALAALSIAALTFFLVRATNRYVAETAKYVRLAQEQLTLLRTQLAAPLLLNASSIHGSTPQICIVCRHSGSPSSLPAILRAVVLTVQPTNSGEDARVAEEVPVGDFVLQPGKAWSKALAGKIAAKVAVMPKPSLTRALFHGGIKKQTSGTLVATLRFQRAGQTETEEVTKEYEIRTHLLKGTTLVPS